MIRGRYGHVEHPTGGTSASEEEEDWIESLGCFRVDDLVMLRIAEQPSRWIYRYIAHLGYVRCHEADAKAAGQQGRKGVMNLARN
jgi:hypothetical protein